MKAPGPEISIVAPMWNESANVLPLAEQVLAAWRDQGCEIELVLVDDASTDGTWERILEVRQGGGRVRGVGHLVHSGQSAALWTGFKGGRGGGMRRRAGDLRTA